MAIERKELPGGMWEISATGKDVHQLKGMLNEHGRDSFEKSYWKSKSAGFDKMRNPMGQVEDVPLDKIDEYKSQGYTAKGSPRMIVPDVPWERGRVSPGRHRYKYDKSTGQMTEVT